MLSGGEVCIRSEYQKERYGRKSRLYAGLGKEEKEVIVEHDEKKRHLSKINEGTSFFSLGMKEKGTSFSI